MLHIRLVFFEARHFGLLQNQNINKQQWTKKKNNRHTINLLKAVSFFLAPPLLATGVM
jgi:hypothetical protein